jgi:hypothetical protein
MVIQPKADREFVARALALGLDPALPIDELMPGAAR